MRVRVVVDQPGGATKTFEVTGHSVRLGRNEECEVTSPWPLGPWPLASGKCSQISNAELGAFANIDHARNEFAAGVPYVGRVAEAPA